MSRTFKLLILSSDRFPPFRVDLAVLFGKKLSGYGHRIDWLLQSEGDCTAAWVTEYGGGTAWVGRTDNGTSAWSRLRKHWFSIAHDLKVFSKARSKKYDFIQVKDKIIGALFGLLAARLYGARFTYWLSFPFPEASLHFAREGVAKYPLFYLLRGHVFRLLMYRIIMPMADHVFVQSEQMMRDVIDEGIDADKLTPVPMGVSLDELPVSANTGAPLEAANQVIIYLGTLNRARHLDFLIRVFGRVHNEVDTARLLIVGSGDEPEDEAILRREARELGIQDVINFTGRLPMKEAWQQVGSAYLGVSPFYPTKILSSTSPTKLVEYMAFSKPVVANDHPEQNLIIRESEAGICVTWDEQEFADAIVRLLRDPELAAEMGKRGRLYVEKHRSYDVISRSVEQKYLEMLG
jgi:glycosyltransferase involved in cell wall biosynthesis